MSGFVQSLECRRLLSVSAAALSTDLTAINTDAATVKADLAALQSGAKADLKTLAADLKGSAKSNAALLKTVATAETKAFGKIKADVGALLKAAGAAKHGAADGNAVIANPGNSNVPIAGDVAALGVATTTPLNNLKNDSSPAVIDADLTALVTANPGNTALATDVAKAKNDLNTLTGKLTADATTFSAAVGTLKTDLSTLLPAPTTTPSLVGDYKGTVKTQGVIFGIGAQTLDFEINITSQTINSVTGSITVSGHSASGTITAKELSNGKLTLTINDSGFTITLNGNVNVKTTSKGLPPGSVISGSGTVGIAGFNISGNFVVTKVS